MKTRRRWGVKVRPFLEGFEERQRIRAEKKRINAAKNKRIREVGPTVRIFKKVRRTYLLTSA